MKVQSISWILRQQISDFFIVNLQVTGSDQELRLFRVSFDSLEDILERPGHDSLLHRVIFDSSHRVSLTSSSLAISKDCSIVPLQNILDNSRSALIINLVLLNAPVESHIKGELLWRLIKTRLLDKDLACL